MKAVCDMRREVDRHCRVCLYCFNSGKLKMSLTITVVQYYKKLSYERVGLVSDSEAVNRRFLSD